MDALAPSAPRPGRLAPLLLDLTDRPCLVVGGGAVGTRRARTLREAGAQVTIVDPTPSSDAEALGERGVSLTRREYRASDLRGCRVVVAATGNPQVDAAIRRDADAAEILCNTASHAEECTVVFPSVLRRSDVVVAVSTGGESPAVAARVRDLIAEVVGPEWGALSEILGGLRAEIRARYPDPDERRVAVDRVMDSEVMDLLSAGDRTAARRRAREILDLEG